MALLIALLVALATGGVQHPAQSAHAHQHVPIAQPCDGIGGMASG